MNIWPALGALSGSEPGQTFDGGGGSTGMLVLLTLDFTITQDCQLSVKIQPRPRSSLTHSTKCSLLAACSNGSSAHCSAATTASSAPKKSLDFRTTRSPPQPYCSYGSALALPFDVYCVRHVHMLIHRAKIWLQRRKIRTVHPRPKSVRRIASGKYCFDQTYIQFLQLLTLQSASTNILSLYFYIRNLKNTAKYPTCW